MRIGTGAILAALVLAPAALAAQGPPRLGGQVSFAQDANAGLGLRFEQPLLPFWTQDLRLDVAFDYYFPDSPVNYWELNGDLAWGFPISGSRMSVYVGGGVNIAREGVTGAPGSGYTNIGLNVLAGVRIPTRSGLTPFVELRPELGGGDRLVLTTGLMF